jgi:hypothetical protein
MIYRIFQAIFDVVALISSESVNSLIYQKLQYVNLDTRKTDLWNSDLKLRTNYFWNAKGFVAVNDKVFNVLWPILEKHKLANHVKFLNLPSRIPLSGKWRKSPDKIMSGVFLHFIFWENVTWKISDKVKMAHVAFYLFFIHIKKFILYDLYIWCYWIDIYQTKWPVSCALIENINAQQNTRKIIFIMKRMDRNKNA